MTNFKYFANQNGMPVELTKVWHDGHVSSKACHFFGLAPNGERLQAQRVVEFKRFPSRHECDARCLNATGRIMKCECSCGGKNHGRGSSIVCEAA